MRAVVVIAAAFAVLYASLSCVCEWAFSYHRLFSLLIDVTFDRFCVAQEANRFVHLLFYGSCAS